MQYALKSIEICNERKREIERANGTNVGKTNHASHELKQQIRRFHLCVLLLCTICNFNCRFFVLEIARSIEERGTLSLFHQICTDALNEGFLLPHFSAKFIFFFIHISGNQTRKNGNFNCILDAAMYTSVPYAQRPSTMQRWHPFSGKLMPNERKKWIHQQLAPEQIINKSDCHISASKRIDQTPEPPSSQWNESRRRKNYGERVRIACAYHISQCPQPSSIRHINHKTLCSNGKCATVKWCQKCNWMCNK